MSTRATFPDASAESAPMATTQHRDVISVKMNLYVWFSTRYKQLHSKTTPIGGWSLCVPEKESKYRKSPICAEVPFIIDCHQIWRVESYWGRYQLCQILGNGFKVFDSVGVKIRYCLLTWDVAVSTGTRSIFGVDSESLWQLRECLELFSIRSLIEKRKKRFFWSHY